MRVRNIVASLVFGVSVRQAQIKELELGTIKTD